MIAQLEAMESIRQQASASADRSVLLTQAGFKQGMTVLAPGIGGSVRSEEHTSELQSL